MYLLYGDIAGAKAKAKKMLGAQLKVDKDASHYIVNEENFSLSTITTLAQSGGLFQSKLVVVLDRIFSNTKLIFSFILLSMLCITPSILSEISFPIFTRVNLNLLNAEFSLSFIRLKNDISPSTLALSFF